MSTMTPYAAHKVVNAELTKVGLPEIRPQMMYNYIRPNAKGVAMIPTITVGGQKQIEEGVLIEWLNKYLEKKGRNKVTSEAAKVFLFAGL